MQVLVLPQEILSLTKVTVVMPFVPISVIEEILTLDPLSTYPDTGNGGVHWKRTTEIASDIFERCPGREWILNVTKVGPTWKCQYIVRIASGLKLTFAQIDGMQSTLSN